MARHAVPNGVFWVSVFVVLTACAGDSSKKATGTKCPALSTNGAEPSGDECPDSGSGQGGAAGMAGMGQGGSMTAGQGGAPSGGQGGTPSGGQAGMAGQGGAGGAVENFCMLGTCPVGLDDSLGLVPMVSPIADYRYETGGPYWDPAQAPPADAVCWCVINEYDDITCTSSADCHDSTCDTTSGLCGRPGQHNHGPYPTSVDPNTSLMNGTWGDHFGPNCPYFHLHSFGVDLVTPPITTGTTEPPDADPREDACGHGGLVWLDDQGNVILGP